MSKKKKGKRKTDTPPRVKPMLLVAADDPVLHGVALPVSDTFNPALVELGERMVATCKKYNGMALAAPQVGVNVRMVALPDGRLVVNPELSRVEVPQVLGREGCLSYPNRWWSVPRYVAVGVTGFNPRTGMMTVIQAEGVEARMWQHEIDHLDGIVLDGRYIEVTDEPTPSTLVER